MSFDTAHSPRVRVKTAARLAATEATTEKFAGVQVDNTKIETIKYGRALLNKVGRALLTTDWRRVSGDAGSERAGG